MRVFVLPIFQFHKGTIKASPSVVALGSVIIFQFHKGTIKALRGREFLTLLLISIP